MINKTMIFTQEQINEIKRRLSIAGSRDTDFSQADFPLTGVETIAIVQEGANKNISIGEFYEEIRQYINIPEGIDIFNVSRYAQRVQKLSEVAALTLPNAIRLCPDSIRRSGQIITFLDKNGDWNLWQYKGTSANDWKNTSSFWVNLDNNLKGIIFTVSDKEFITGETKDVRFHFETLDGEKADVVQLFKDDELFQTHKNISSFDFTLPISWRGKYTLKVSQYGQEYEQTHNITALCPAWVGAGEVYTDVVHHKNSHKLDTYEDINGSYNVQFDSSRARYDNLGEYLWIIMPTQTYTGIDLDSVAMNGIEVPMEEVQYEVDINEPLTNVNYTAWKSINEYVTGTYSFKVTFKKYEEE